MFVFVTKLRLVTIGYNNNTLYLQILIIFMLVFGYTAQFLDICYGTYFITSFNFCTIDVSNYIRGLADIFISLKLFVNVR